MERVRKERIINVEYMNAFAKVRNLFRKKETKTHRTVRLAVTGFCMGMADLIPGVSGGTVAFLAGIYQELLESIKIVTGKALKLVVKGKIRQAFDLVPFRFLIPLLIGLFGAIFGLSGVLTWLFEHFSVAVWAFFFGLVLASVYIVLKRVSVWNIARGISFLVAMVFAYFLVGAVPTETPNSLPYIFGSGVLAISAMLLPGISGSFILLIIGKYQQILAAAAERDFFTLAVFAAGAVVGIALFARLFSWLFSKYHDMAVAVLAGFMLGSVRKLWPWKEVVSTRVNSHGETVPFIEQNVLPHTMDISVYVAILLFVFAFWLMWILDKKQLVKEHTHDL